MKKLLMVCILSIPACQAADNAPQNFEDLLKLTDMTDAQICTLPLEDLRRRVSEAEFEKAKTEAFDYAAIIDQYAEDPASQIQIIFRRAALKRRLMVGTDNTQPANEFYDTLNAGETEPVRLVEFHDGYHYWTNRIQEQSQYGEPDSVPYNLRFCVINEKRAKLHAQSRTDILNRVAQGVALPAPELIENINHEATFDDKFTNDMLSKIFTEDNFSTLTPFERAQLRSTTSFLPTDSRTADLFWETRDAEISSVIEFITSHDFSSPADKLGYMTSIDQSVRKLWSDPTTQQHFESAEEYEAFKAGIVSRMIKVDAFNTQELQKMLVGRGWFRDDKDGSGAANDAWLIAQHADQNPEFQAEALKLIEAEFDAPGVSKSNYAYLYDRVQMRFTEGMDAEKRIQRYGTQGRCTGAGTWEPFAVESPEKIDEIRAEMGLGQMADYISRFKNICQGDER